MELVESSVLTVHVCIDNLTHHQKTDLYMFRANFPPFVSHLVLDNAVYT